MLTTDIVVIVEVSKVKMSTRSADCSISWSGRGVLAITTGELRSVSSDSTLFPVKTNSISWSV